MGFPSLHDQITQTSDEKTGRKRNFSECELETLLNEVKACKHFLFGTMSSGINSKHKRSEWESVCEAVNAVGLEQHTPTELKKKWSNIKVEVKRRTAAHRQSVAKTGGGKGEEELTLFEQRVAAIVGDTALTGVVGAHVGDSDYSQGKYILFICLTHNKCVHYTGLLCPV